MGKRWMLPWAVAVALSCSVAAVALADAIPSPPRNCARGSYGRSSHEGARCEPRRTCTATTACGHGQQCAPTALCIHRRTGPAGGLFPDGVPHPTVRIDEVNGVCGANDACPNGSRCG